MLFNVCIVVYLGFTGGPSATHCYRADAGITSAAIRQCVETDKHDPVMSCRVFADDKARAIRIEYTDLTGGAQ